MPTATEITMAKMLVANLGSGKKDGLLDLLCEHDPATVVHLLQLQGRHVQSLQPFDVIIGDSNISKKADQQGEPPAPVLLDVTVEPEAVMDHGTSSISIAFESTPLTEKPALDVAVIACDNGTQAESVAEEALVSGNMGEEMDDHEGNTTFCEMIENDEETTSEYEPDALESDDDHSPEEPQPKNKEAYRWRTQSEKTMAYKDFSSLVRSRADRLHAHDMQYRLEGRELVKNDFLRWIVQTEREIVAKGDLRASESFKSFPSVRCFIDNYGYGSRTRYPALGRWHPNIYPGVPFSHPDPAYPSRNMARSTATGPLKNAKRARVDSTAP